MLQECPDECSYQGGVSSSGVQAASGSVAGLPSFAASWIAVTGRQDFQCALSLWHAITASAVDSPTWANSRALSSADSPWPVASARSIASCGTEAHQRAASVWSAVRVVLVREPTDLTSLKSSAYAALVSGFGPSER